MHQYIIDAWISDPNLLEAAKFIDACLSFIFVVSVTVCVFVAGSSALDLCFGFYLFLLGRFGIVS